MRQKLIELSEILKQKPEIKERLDGYVCHYECYELLIGYHDVLEYLGDEDYCLYHLGIGYLGNIIISLSPGLLSDQSDETLDEIISLCKNVGDYTNLK